MKTKLLLLFSFFTVAGFSQQIINSYYPVDLAVYSVVTSATPFNQDATGPDVTWDFNNLTTVGYSYDSYGTVDASILADYPNTTAVNYTLTNIGEQEISSAIYSSDVASAISVTGAVNGGLTLNYTTNNALIGSYPINYGFSNSDNVAGTFDNGTYSGTFTGTITTSADAYGTLNISGTDLTPHNTEATRLKNVQNLTLFYGIFGNVGTVTITTCLYYSEISGNNQPVFRNTTTAINVPLLSINQTTTQFEYFNVFLLGTNQPEIQSKSLSISPNPVTDFLTIQTNETIQSVSISDVNGRLVLQSNSPLNTINVGDLKNGLFFATIATNTGIVTKKIIKK